MSNNKRILENQLLYRFSQLPLKRKCVQSAYYSEGRRARIYSSFENFQDAADYYSCVEPINRDFFKLGWDEAVVCEESILTELVDC